ncbi:MAG: Arginase [Patescibacteria group bacterium]|nr:Arginase [Patescibacteria group bacterium]
MTKPSTPYSLIGVPLDLGAQNLGVDIGPDAFRYAGIIDKLAGAGLAVRDEGTITVADRAQLEPGNPRLRYAGEIIRVSNKSAKLTEQLVRGGRRVIGLGGDHSMTLGLVSGASTALGGELGLIYLDAHGDMNTADTTLSGNIHGMHLASLMGFGAPELAHVHTPEIKIAKQNLLHIGGSDWDQPELDLIGREDLATFSLFDLLKSNLAPLLAMVDDLATRVPNVWISLDLDVIDRLYAPGAGMPNAKGLTYREIATIAEYIGHHANVVGVDVVEYNPLHDEQSKTAELGIELIAKFFGHNYSWYTNYMARNQIN